MKETPSQLRLPSYILNFPFTLDTKDPNNIWMTELKPEELKINKNKAYAQWLDLYSFMASDSLIYLLPSAGNYQDQVYTANLGRFLYHIKDENHLILSNFTSKPRQGEEIVGKPFFDLMGYQTHICPHKWEGEADLKYLTNNIYIGGYGIRTEKESYDWMEKTFNMNIIKLGMVDEYLYHLDCSLFPINKEKIMICTELFEEKELAELEKHAELIDIDIDSAYGGICNSVRMGNTIMCASNISELKQGEELYELEKYKIELLNKICMNEGMEPVIFNLSEYMKSGAMLSCMVMHLNHIDMEKSLI